MSPTPTSEQVVFTDLMSCRYEDTERLNSGRRSCSHAAGQFDDDARHFPCGITDPEECETYRALESRRKKRGD